MSTTVHATASGTRLAYRFVTGAELDGIRRTDARWRRKGRQILNDEGFVWAWHFLPRGQRALIRCGSAALAVLLPVGYWSAPDQTESLIQFLLGLGVLVFAHWFWTMLQAVEIKHRFLGPTADVLAARFGFAPPTDPASWVTVHPDSRTNADHPIEVVLPDTYRESDRQQDQTAKIIARKNRIPVDRMDYEIDWQGDKPRFVVRAMEVPPPLVDFAMAKPYLEQATDTRYFLGLGLRDEPMWIDLDLDSPHIAFSFGSGGGKSTVIRLLAAQVLRLGGRVVILDHAKEGDSHADWVYDDHGNLLPGVEFYTDTEAVHEALISLEEERTRRSKLAHQAKRFKRTPPHFQRTLVVMEELNTGTPMLQNHWKWLRKQLKDAEGDDQPVVSPAMAATAALVNAGRAQRMNCAAVAQRFDAKVIGGGDVRSSFMVRVLARFGEDARKMLIPTVDPKPRSSNHPGRVVLAAESESQLVQAAFLTSAEAQEWALGGYREVLEAGGVADSESDDLVGAHASDQQDQRTESVEMPALPALPPPDAVELVTLEQAIDAGIVDTNLQNLQWHARQSGFPAKQPGKGGKKGTANLYAAHQLADWESKRQRKAAV